jgi:DNA-binding NarL/FixJ family response regulator
MMMRWLSAAIAFRKKRVGDRMSINVSNDGERPSLSAQPRAEPDRKQRVLLVDRVRLSRECLSQQIQDLCPDIALSVAPSAVAALDSAISGPPDVVILNAHGANLSDPDLVHAVDAIRSSSIPVVVIVERVDSAQIEEAEKHALCGVFPAYESVKLLAAAIRLVLAGGRFLPAERRNTSIIQGFSTPESGGRSVGDERASDKRALDAPATSATGRFEPRFSTRELEIIKLLRKGLQNKNIAFELGISESTVKAHLAHIMRKLGVANRTTIVSTILEK